MARLNRFALAFHALFSHWRRNKGQFFTLFLGLSLATALWSGVQAINAEARASYAKAQETLSANGRPQVLAKAGKKLTIADFVVLQRAGWRTSAVVQGEYRMGRRRVTLLGVDPLTAPLPQLANAISGLQMPAEGAVTLTQFMTGQGVGFAARQTLDDLRGQAELSGKDFPVLRPMEDISPGLILTDIGIAARLLNKGSEISRLTVIAQPQDAAARLDELLPHARLHLPEGTGDVARLTDSFHLNLTAFGLLSFAVGLFIVNGTIGLAFEQRRGLCRTLRVLGLSLSELTAALVAELMVFALAAGALGVVLGYLIAAFLLPDVAATLRGLYGAEVSGQLSLRPQWWLAGLGIALAGTGIAAAASLVKVWRMPILAAAQPRAWAMMSERTRRLQIASAVLLIATGLILLILGSGLIAAFALLGCLLVGAAMALPALFSVILRLAERGAHRPVSQWFWADTRQQVPGLSLALMALLLALAANIGVGTMVGSFRSTFTGWLDQRLASELYVSAADDAQATRLRAWLEQRSTAVLPIWHVKREILGKKGEIYGVADHATYRDNWPLLSAIPGVWDQLASGSAMLVNEQLARGNGLALGDRLALPEGPELPIAGIYSDYGNPAPQILIAVPLLTKTYPEVERLRFGVRIASDKVNALADAVRETFVLDPANVVHQADIKRLSLRIFERTFAVTDALNLLTLAVAGFAIFTSLLTLATMRLPQLAPVWALGLTRRTLARLELLRALLLAFLTFCFALPVGLVLAWILLAVVNVEAFGWRLPMQVFPLEWLRLGGFALLAVVLAAFLPARRLAATRPADLVKVFTHER